jgi:hypothetical protein
VRLGWRSQHGLQSEGQDSRQREDFPELFIARPDSPAPRRMGLSPSILSARYERPAFEDCYFPKGAQSKEMPPPGVTRTSHLRQELGNLLVTR